MQFNSCNVQGYHGCAVGKGKSVAKTEIEKLKLEEMTVREAVNEITRMYGHRLRFHIYVYTRILRC